MKRTVILCSLMAYMAFITCSSPEKKVEKEDAYGEYEIADPSTKESVTTHRIEIREMKFVPDVVTAKKGDKIIWMNNDIVDHDVTEMNSNAWASSRLKPGTSWEMIVTKSEVYFCNLHVVMKGKLVVDGTYLSMIDESGITICKVTR